MAGLAHVFAFLAVGSSALLFFRIRSLTSIVLWMPKALAGSAAAFLALMGGLGAVLGLLYRRPVAIAAGALGALLSARYVLRAAAPHNGFECAFGLDWTGQIPSECRARMLKRRWVLRLPSHPDVRWERDVPFWTLPSTDRQLLCDVWQPPEGVPPSGLGFIYLHGGAWHFMDKDYSTRPFFRHLAAQGHVVMDVAYRLCPEVDIYGMVGDVRRAIVWMKANADMCGVDPERVVVAGGSNGGHLALLAAYAPDHSEPSEPMHRVELQDTTSGRGLTPDDVRGADMDTSVRAVVAFYGMADARAVYQHFDSAFGSLGKAPESGVTGILYRITGALTRSIMGSSAVKEEQQGISVAGEISCIGLFPWLMTNLLGGRPDEVPEVYELASPITHVGPDSPPTLLLQGAHDSFHPAHITRALHNKLVGAGVPSVYVEFPQTEHGFDMALPRYAPAAQAALYDVERFLALMV